MTNLITVQLSTTCSNSFGNLASSLLFGSGGISKSDNTQINAKIERENDCHDGSNCQNAGITSISIHDSNDSNVNEEIKVT